MAIEIVVRAGIEGPAKRGVCSIGACDDIAASVPGDAGSGKRQTSWLRGRLRSLVAPLPFDPIVEARRQWDRHWGPSAGPSMVAVTSIMRAQQILIARLNGLLRPWDLTFPRYEALMLLFYSRNGSLPLGKIGERLQVHRTSVTNLVDGLEKLGYVQRSPHERDRRTTLATITDRGREVADAATRTLNDERFGTAPLGSEELETLFGVLRQIREDADDFAEPD